jgi:TPR repeat protein
MEMRYGTVAGLDVHKKTVVVIVLQSMQPDQDFASGIFGTTQFGLKELVAFLRQQGLRTRLWSRRHSSGDRYGWRWRANAQAVNWYRKAADAGDASAMNSLGSMYDYGRGVAQPTGRAGADFEYQDGSRRIQ